MRQQICQIIHSFLLFACCYLAAAQLQAGAVTAAATFECGKPQGACGSAIPPGMTCPKGQGWCQVGHFCGTQKSILEPPRCLPLPEKCGMNGNSCCPSNTDSPHTSMEDKLNRKPFCKDGSTCFYIAPTRGANNGDMYAGNQGISACRQVPADCGTGPGAPCCPYPYHVDANPPLKQVGCVNAPNMYCSFATPAAPGKHNSGVCRANAKDCGAFGRRCCILSGPSGPARLCGRGVPAGMGAPLTSVGGLAPKGYCARNSPNVDEGVCKPCPAGRVSTDEVQENPDLAPCSY